MPLLSCLALIILSLCVFQYQRKFSNSERSCSLLTPWKWLLTLLSAPRYSAPQQAHGYNYSI